MQKQFITVKDISIHYRSAGEGFPIVLFHPSPRSSKLLEPFGNLLKSTFRVIIPDIPGYGFSDAMPENVNTLYDYLPYFKAFFENLGLNKFALYGTATGAQLGIAYALTYPNTVKHLFLDNAAHFKDEQAAAITEHYFPDFSPQADGSHLIKMWQHLRDMCLFFPWFDYQKGKRLSTGIPPANILNEILKDYLLAGENWDSAYKAAFAHERAEKVKVLQVPTVLFRWEASILVDYIDQLIAEGLPDNIEIVATSAPLNERYQEMIEVISKKAS